VPNPDRFLRRFCTKGIGAIDGKLVSPAVPAPQLTSAVMLVANASAAAAHWGVEHLKVKRHRDLRAALYGSLAKHFAAERIERQGHLFGKSNKRYRFDNVVTLNASHKLVVDAVQPDPNSINSRTVAHLDVRQLEDPNIIQRIVYDQEEDWDSADLNLLQMAATLIPLSHLEHGLTRLRAHQIEGSLG
jgi:hypothetical protein